MSGTTCAGPTVYLAQGTDGDHFTYTGAVSSQCLLNPEVTVHGSEYILTATGGAPYGVMMAVSANPASFPGARLVLSPGIANSWDANGVETPFFLPGEDRLYYAAREDANGWGSPAPVTIGVVILNSKMKLYTLAPCRVLDTRDPIGAYGGPVLAGGVARTFIAWSRCGIPGTAKALAANLTVVSPTSPGSFTLVPGGQPYLNSSSMSFSTGAVRANNAIVDLVGPVPGSFTIFNNLPLGQATHAIVDVSGYFAPVSDADIGP